MNRPFRRPAVQGDLAGRAQALLGGAGIRNATVAEAIGCSHAAVCHWVYGVKSPSLKDGTAGRRFLALLAGLAAADTAYDQAVAEARRMDNEGHGERWAKYDRRWVWVAAPEGPRVVRASRRRRRGVLLRGRVPQPRRQADPAGVGVASGAQ